MLGSEVRLLTMRRTRFFTLIVLLASLLPLPAIAETKKPDPQREQIRRLQQVQRKTEQEKATLQLEKSAVEEQLKASTEKAQDLEKTAQRSTSLAKQKTAQITGLETQMSELKARLAESEKRVAQSAESQQKSLAEISRLQTQLAKLNKDLAASEAKNLQLYKYSVELMDRYQNKGVWTSVAQMEPFTGLKRVEIENLLDEYRDKLDAQKVESAAAKP